MRRSFYLGLGALAAFAIVSSAARADGGGYEPGPSVSKNYDPPLAPLPRAPGRVVNAPTKIIVHQHFYNAAPPQVVVRETATVTDTLYGRDPGVVYAPPPPPAYYGGPVGYRPDFYQGDPAGFFVGRRYVPFGGSYGTPPYPRPSGDLYGYGYYLHQNSRAIGY